MSGYRQPNYSYKTTICGVITAIGAVFSQSGIHALEVIGQFLVPIGSLCTGLYAADN